MWCSFAVLFVRYNMATFLSAFFPDYADKRSISDAISGAIFAAYPIGMFLASLVATRIIIRVGLRKSILVGMMLNAVSILGMGLIPSVFRDDACNKDAHSGSCVGLQMGFFVFYFMSGLLGAVAECGCFIALQNWNKDHSATMVAAGSMVCGIGCMVGPEIGGVLHDVGDKTPFGSFFLPFLLFSVVPALISFLILMFFPEVAKIDGEKQTAPASSVMSTSFVLTWIGYALNGTIVATLDPTLEKKLNKNPFNCSSTVVGLVFMASSVVYTAMTYPVGWASDTRWKGKSATLKRVLAFSMFSLFICFAALGPFKIGKIDLQSADGWFLVSAAMLFKGVGSSLGVVAYADMIVGVDPDDDVLQATIVALNNAAYAIGWGAGPLLGGGLLNAFSGDDAAQFSGYSTVVAMISLVYGAVLLVAPLVGGVASPGGYLPLKKEGGDAAGPRD